MGVCNEHNCTRNRILNSELRTTCGGVALRGLGTSLHFVLRWRILGQVSWAVSKDVEGELAQCDFSGNSARRNSAYVVSIVRLGGGIHTGTRTTVNSRSFVDEYGDCVPYPYPPTGRKGAFSRQEQVAI